MEKKSLQEILAMSSAREKKATCSIPGYTQPRKKPADVEHNTQVACVNAFRTIYPQYAGILIAVPNGGRRDKVTGAKLKAEGAVAGASDLLFLHSTRTYGYLAIEMKTEIGRQSDSQKAFQAAVESNGGKYALCRSVESFLKEIKDYLNEENYGEGHTCILPKLA